ncbi:MULTISPECIES: hypothetical protein [unclassified Spiroplasma]|uniref:hypothetical protein n=1 Tax=unclassified Spiroplasma TaxID=2637901 RepID=UPI0030CB6E0F
MEQMRTFTLEQMEQLAIEPGLIDEIMRLSEEEEQVELAKKLSLEKEKQSDIIIKEFKETSMPSSQTFKVETEVKLVTEEEILKQGVRPKGSKIVQRQIQHTNNNHQEKAIISEPTISPSLYESSLDLQVTNEDDEFGFVVVDEPYKTLQSEEVSEKERENIDRAIALEALSLKRQSNLMQVIKKSEIEEIKVLEQQKINKFLNLFIKLVTFGKINKNKKIELEISKKWKKYQNHVVKSQKQIRHYFQNHLEKLLINNK